MQVESDTVVKCMNTSKCQMMKILPQKVPPQIANINTNSNILANKTWVPHDKRPWLTMYKEKL